VHTGPTLTNVMDMAIVILEKRAYPNVKHA